MALAPATPPPMPEGAESVEFETEAAPEPDPAPAASEDNGGASEVHPKYWGIAAGEPLPLRWEDLMPEGSEEELYRQQEEFYRMLQQRYAANSSSLADAQPFDEIEEGSAMDFMPQFGTFDVVEDLDGELIRIPGYVVPFDFTPNRRLNEFLFVPYMGACIHTPPPPPNQIIFVRADPAVKVDDIWAPYWLEGELSAEVNENEVGDAAYALSLTEMEPYPVP
ncbi:MAG: DUF3299 domain-containing protein [Hyphomonadaceae bacterium]|nr:DUF3299 domain-containing protein [Hyphomonadaceae bacterium]